MADHSIKDLEKWDELIREKVAEFGLDPFPQIFEICDSDQMIGYMAYSGMPSRYPHWSFGKQFEKQKTQYDYGVSGLPYEMVINSDPCLAYLMSENSLLLQILTIAHVYAHNDFFRHNFTFRNTHPEYTLERFKTRADRVRKYMEDTSIGAQAVEELLDAAHTLSFNCDRYGSSENASRETETSKRDKEVSQDKDAIEPNETGKNTREEKPQRNLLLYIRDNAHHLKEWQRDLLTIVHEEAQYFIPQMETKIMNEGWASYWHKTILDSLDLPQDLRMEFYVRHNQVLRPIPGGMNPYYVGYTILQDIENLWDEESLDENSKYDRPGGEGREKLFQVRETDRDESFLRQYMTKEVMRELDLFQHEKKGNDRVVTKVASEKDWEEVRQSLIRNVGMNSFPIIKIAGSKEIGSSTLNLIHEFDGRELDNEYARKTIGYVHRLWQAPVHVLTMANGKESIMMMNEQDKLEVKAK